MTAAGSLVGSAAQLAGLFRSDYGISALATTIGATPLIAAVARELIGKDHATVVDGFSLVQGSVVLEDLRGAWRQRRQLEKLKIMEEQRIAADASKADDLRARLKDAATAYDKALAEDKADVDLTKLQEVLTRLRGDINSLEASLQRPRTNIALATAVAARFDTFATSVAAVPPGGGYAPIISAALREQLHGQEPTVSHVLFLSVDTAGAETVTIRGLLRQRVRFVGGLHASYLLLGVTEKTVVAAGTAGAIRQVNYKLGSGNFKPAEGQDLYPNNDA
jgi:hypothetical protein